MFWDPITIYKYRDMSGWACRDRPKITISPPTLHAHGWGAYDKKITRRPQQTASAGFVILIVPAHVTRVPVRGRAVQVHGRALQRVHMVL